jgi:alanine racemase
MVKKITIKDIAEETGLSMNTVSKVLNKKPYYTKEIEQRVMKAVKELGYISNSLAAGLRSGSSMTISIVYDDFTNPYYSYMTNIIARSLGKLGYVPMIFSNYNGGGFLKFDLYAQILSRKADGIISFIEPEEDVVKHIKRSGIPFVVLGRDCHESGVDSVYADDFEGGRAATELLINCGYTDIFYAGCNPGIKVDKERFAGYRAALAQHGVKFDERNVNYVSSVSGAANLADFIVENSSARAIFCFNDFFSFNIVRRLQQRGFSLPHDYALVGFDNIQEYLGLPAILTTVSKDVNGMADLAVKMIIAKIKNEPIACVEMPLKDIKIIPGTTTP